jgi:ATP-dependent Clp protease adaptor protein ClpS
MSTQTIDKPSSSAKLAPRYRVLLHNDDYNSMEYVVQCLLEVVNVLTQPQAVEIMLEAHNNGVALVTTCMKEHAEFYAEGLCSKGLTSTIEPE